MAAASCAIQFAAAAVASATARSRTAAAAHVSAAAAGSFRTAAPSAAVASTSLLTHNTIGFFQARRPMASTAAAAAAAADASHSGAGAAVAVESPPTPPPAAAAAPAEKPALSEEDALVLVQGLELRVGRIVKAWKHPEADSLYVEEVDVGEPEGPRTICSGLVKYVTEEELQNRLVVVLANLKPRNMRGVKSNGMLLAASDASHENVELLTPPDGAQPGERIWFGGEVEGGKQGAAATPNQLQKKKVWETLQPLLATTAECVAALHGRPMRVVAGVITCKSLAGANIG